MTRQRTYDPGQDYAGPVKERPPGRPPLVDTMVSAASALWTGADVPEQELEADPDFPPSAVRLAEHSRGVAWCRREIQRWQREGFLPVAISRLVGLCPEDCVRCAELNAHTAADPAPAESPYCGSKREVVGKSARCGRAHVV